MTAPPVSDISDENKNIFRQIFPQIGRYVQVSRVQCMHMTGIQGLRCKHGFSNSA